jgi:hypothetical protein
MKICSTKIKQNRTKTQVMQGNEEDQSYKIGFQTLLATRKIAKPQNLEIMHHHLHLDFSPPYMLEPL